MIKFNDFDYKSQTEFSYSIIKCYLKAVMQAKNVYLNKS